MKHATFNYAGTVIVVEDGDSISAALDLGLHVWSHTPLRLFGCNARELKQPGGPEARDNLRALLPPGTPIAVTTLGEDKYGARWQARVKLADGTDLVTQLIAQQWAAPWNGQGAKPVPPWPRTV